MNFIDPRDKFSFIGLKLSKIVSIRFTFGMISTQMILAYLLGGSVKGYLFLTIEINVFYGM